MSLDITQDRADALTDLEGFAIEILRQCLSGETEMDDKASLAIKTANMVAKNRVTLTAREHIRFTMAQSIAEPEALERYVQTTQPEIKKALSA
jgi:hypothetical protein